MLNLLRYSIQDNWPSVMFAMAGGVALSLGNLSSQYAWAFVGLSVAEVLTSSLIVVIGLNFCSFLSLTLFILYVFNLICYSNRCLNSDRIPPLGYCLNFLFLFWVEGSTLNYFLDDKINKAEILFPGVACFVIAVCLGSAVHSSNVADDKAKLESLSAKSRKESTYVLCVPIC